MAGLEEGIALIRNNKLFEAESFFISELEKNPFHEGMWRFLGRTQAEIGKKGSAIQSIEKAIELNKNQPMWLYKVLVECKLKFEFIDEHCDLDNPTKELLLKKNKLMDFLELDTITYPDEIYKGDGLLGKKIMFKAISDRYISFISPFDGKRVQSLKSISEYIYWFEEGFFLSFFSDWAHPFFSYQFYIPSEDRVLFGYLDDHSELALYNKSYDFLVMYYAKFFRTINVYKSSYEEYLQSTVLNKLIVKNQDYKHIGHSIWNGVSALVPFVKSKTWKDRVDGFILDAPVLGSTLLQTFNDKLKQYNLNKYSSLEESIYHENLFLITLKDNYIHNLVSRFILRSSIDNCLEKNEVIKFREKHFPVVLLGIRLGTRQWINQKETYCLLIDELVSKYPNIGFIVDGMNIIESEVHSSHGNIDLNAEVQLAEDLLEKNKNVISVVGTTLQQNISWIEIADLCIVPWGAGLAKYKWINNKKCVVVGSKCILDEKNDLHIYDSDKYMEYAITDTWLNSKYSTNLTYSSFSDFKKNPQAQIQYYYQDYICDAYEVLRLVNAELDLISSMKNMNQFQSLKLFN